MLINIIILGLCVGSFINMLVYRTAVGYGLTKDKIHNKSRSFCDFCGKQLRWYENIPVFSWLFQLGRSRCCQEKLPLAYPIIELVTGLVFVVLGLDPIKWLAAALLIFSFVFDTKFMVLPDFSTYILMAISVIVGGNWLAGLGSFVFLALIYFGTRGRGMGFGDVKFAIFMGILLGWPKIVIAFYVAFISGALLGVILLLTGVRGRKSAIAFGPFLILGTVVAWYDGLEIWEAFVSGRVFLW